MKNRSGFTIVELLIVIVVIGILAAISVVAYNGIQQRAENAKTVAAVSTWVKALRMYEVDKGEWPTSSSCLGAPTTYTGSYSGRCWPTETSSWVVNPTFLTLMQPYIGTSYPEPSSKNVSGDSVTQYRGAMFYRASSTDIRVYAMFLGVNTCPRISGLPDAYSGQNNPDGRNCYYYLQQP